MKYYFFKRWLKNFLNIFSFKKIRSKLIVAFLFLIILPIIFVNIFAYVLLQGMIKEKMNIHFKNTISQASLRVERIFEDMFTTTNILMMDQDVLEILDASLQEKNENLRSNFLTMNSKFIDIQLSALDAYVDSVIAIKDKDNYLYTTIARSPQDRCKNIEALFNEEEILPDNNYNRWGQKVYGIPSLLALKKINYVVLIKSYNDFVWGEKQGDIVLGIAENEFSQILQENEIFPGTRVYITNEYGVILSSVNKTQIGNKLKIYAHLENFKNSEVTVTELKEQKCVIYSKKFKYSDYSIVQVVPNEVLLSEMMKIKLLMLCSGIIFILLFLSVSYMVIKNITDPIKKLSSASMEIACGNLEAKVAVKGKDEIAKLADNFNKMTIRLQTLLQKMNENEKAKRELELQMLYAQINPHFLFNTLNSIRWMAVTSKVYNISKIIVALAELLQSSIITQNEYISIEEEIKNVKNYIIIQKLRFISLFECEYNISQDISECKILKLILQPIVENSIIHGFEGISYKGRISIAGYREGDKIKLIVSDNGVGMSQEHLAKIMSGSEERNKGCFSGIGISNVNQRLILHVGSKYGLYIESGQGKGTTVEITLPIL